MGDRFRGAAAAGRTQPAQVGAALDALTSPIARSSPTRTSFLYVAAFGSSKVGTVSTAALENDTFVPAAGDHIELTGGGPSGLVLDATNDRLYVSVGDRC